MVVLKNSDVSCGWSKKINMNVNKHETDTESIGSQKTAFNADTNTATGLDDDCPEIIHLCLDAVWKFFQHIKQVATNVLRDLGGYEAFDKLLQWSIRNPHTAICIFAGVLVTLLPCLLILGIGISTLLMTFTGFLILEGILLTIVATLLLGCLGFFVLMLLLMKQINRSI